MLNVGTNTASEIRDSWYDLREMDPELALVKAVLEVSQQLAELNHKAECVLDVLTRSLLKEARDE